MKRLISLILILLCAISFCACGKNDGGGSTKETHYTVRFMTNRSGEDVSLSSKYSATGENVLFYAAEIKAGEKAVKPASDPQLGGYDFVGWAVEKNGALYDFNSAVNGSLTLYAKYARAAASSGDADFKEAEFVFEEKKDAAVDGIEVYKVCNQPVENGNVNLTALAIRLLSEADDVRHYLGYAVNPSAEISSAVYSGGKITVEYAWEGQKSLEITVTDVTASLKVNNDTYENKAKKYEQTASLKRKGIVMAGSSSMENWTTSKEDMSPLSTVNVGIGGTVAEQWTESLAQRLIYPFDPRAVVLYVGVNNIVNASKTGEQTGNALKLLFDDIHAHLPDATVYFIMINDIPLVYQSDRIGQREEIEIANGIVREYAEGKEWMVLVDAGAGLIKDSGKPNSAYFLTDGLHMSLCGYAIWGAAVKEAVIGRERVIYG